MTPIPGYPDYFVNEDGHVFSTKSGNARRIYGTRHSKGGQRIDLWTEDGFLDKIAIHRLMGATFLNLDLDTWDVVRHLDHDKQNNQLQNLKLVTRDEITIEQRERHQRNQ